MMDFTQEQIDLIANMNRTIVEVMLMVDRKNFPENKDGGVDSSSVENVLTMILFKMLTEAAIDFKNRPLECKAFQIGMLTGIHDNVVRALAEQASGGVKL